MTPSSLSMGTSAISALGAAFRRAILDPNTPTLIRDALFLLVAQLRDKLPLEKALAVNAAEAEAVLSAFTSSGPPQSLQLTDVEIPLDGSQATFEALPIQADNQ